MKVAVVSDLETKGGAAIAATRICRGLEAGGAEVRRFVRRRQTPDAVQVSPDRTQDVLVEFLMRRTGQRGRVKRRRVAVSDALVAKAVDRYRPDVVHVHNLHFNAFGIGAVARLRALGYPVVWTLHDAWAFTGGCVYPYDCDLFYRGGCDHTCPIPERYPVLDPRHIRADYEARRAFYRGQGRDLVFVTPSRWLAGEARKGMLAEHRIEVIPNGIDLEVFKPFPADAARRALDLPEGVPILLAGTQTLAEERKGATYLMQALEMLPARREVCLVTFGVSAAVKSPVPTVSLGTVRDDRLTRLCYAAADLFVLPTLADNLPNTLVEATACGTPSVAFDVGGVSEIVHDGRTGFLARCRDARDLADKIERVLALDPEEHAKMRSACRDWALRAYDHRAQGRAYLNLFGSLVGAR